MNKEIKYNWYLQEEHIILVMKTVERIISFSIPVDYDMMKFIVKRMKEEYENQQHSCTE